MASFANVKRLDNRRRVLNVLRRDGPASRAALARTLGLSKATLSAIASEALAAGWLEQRQGKAGGVGRRPTLLSLAPALGFVAAIDINVRLLSIRLSDLNGAPLAEVTRSTPATAPALQSLVVDELEAVCTDYGLSSRLLRAVALSLPATIDAEGRLDAVGQPAYMLQIDWYSTLQQRFADALVRLVNNSDAAALAEHRQGVATDWASFAYLGVGRGGLGVGLVLRGELYSGGRHGAGAIGALALSEGEQPLDGLAQQPRTTVFYRRLARVITFIDHLLDLDGVVLHAVDLEHATLLAGLAEPLATLAAHPVMLRAAKLQSQAPLAGAARLASAAGWQDRLARIATGQVAS